MKLKMPFRMTSMRIIAIGFALLILVGAMLLSTPLASRNGEPLQFFDALFTSTSATCVTGLVVTDTYTQFSFFGQLVILILIQIGGLGFMTVAILFSLLIGKKIGLRQRSILMDSVSTFHIGGVVKLVRQALIGTAIFELTGAAVLSTRFIPRFGVADGIWYSLFHSVSAFCNAGFDLMGKISPFSSLTSFNDDPVVCVTVMILILTGGLGFLVWQDIAEKKFRISKYRLQTKIMLSFTAALVIIPSVIFFFSEKNFAYAGMSEGKRLLCSLFSAVTPRTAGFNTTDFAQLSEGGTILTILLMFIGGGAGSTAGGLKVTTFAVMLLMVAATAKRRGDMNIFRRRLEDGIPSRVLSAVSSYFVMCITGIFILCLGGAQVKQAIFECFSAVSTVGLSMSLTPTLPTLSRAALCLMMFGGRIGTVSVAMALAENTVSPDIKYPTEKIIVG